MSGSVCGDSNGRGGGGRGIGVSVGGRGARRKRSHNDALADGGGDRVTRYICV